MATEDFSWVDRTDDDRTIALPPPTIDEDDDILDNLLDPSLNLGVITEEPISQSERSQDDWLKTNTSWSFKGAAKGTGRVVGRSFVRPLDDARSLFADAFVLDDPVKWEDSLFDTPQSSVEDISSEIGSWLTTFFIPGGYVAKGATKVGKTTKARAIVDSIGKTERGRKALKLGRVAGEGAVAGFVADFITTDTEDTQGAQALMERTQASLQGMVIGGGVNLGVAGVSRIAGASMRKWKAIRQVRKAAEGKADPVAALKSLKKAIQEENQIKKEMVEELDKTDELAKPLDLDNIDNDGVPSSRPEPKPESDADPTFQKDAAKKERPKKTPEQEMLSLEEYIQRGSGLPDQLDRLVRLNVSIADKINPVLSDLVNAIVKAESDPNMIGRVKELIISMETDLYRYKKLTELNAKAGNITGKSLRAFHGDGANFSKPFKYKPEVLKRRNQIDSLLEFIGKTKNSPQFEKKLAKDILEEISELVRIEKGESLSSVLDKKFRTSRDGAVDNVWEQYKKTISDRVQGLLKPTKEKQKAALDEFSNRVGKIVGDAVAPVKEIKKEADKALKQATDILDNPKKYKESIEKLIDDIEKSTEIPDISKQRAIETLTDLVEGNVGKTLFEGLPQHTKMINSIIKEELGNIGTSLKKAVAEGREAELVDEVLENIASKTNLGEFQKGVLLDNVRVELGNAISEIKDKTVRDFINKELYRKFNLHEELADLQRMEGATIEDIRKYLESATKKRKPTPEDIKHLQAQVRAAKKTLEDRSHNAYVQELLTKLGALKEYSDPLMSDWELMVRAFMKFRLNSMLFNPRTWLVGIPSGMFNLAYQPFKQALTEFYKVTGTGFDNANSSTKIIEGLKRAFNEVKATVEYGSNFSDMLGLMKQTFLENGRSAFNPHSVLRHQEDLVKEGMGNIDKIKVPLKDRKKLKELVHRYGVDNQENQNALRSFLSDIIEGTPTTTIGKLMDPMFSASFRMMGMFDEPLKYIGTMRALRAEALQEGMTKQLEGEALVDFVEEYMKKAVARKDGLPQWINNEEFDHIEQLGMAITYQEKYSEKVLSSMAQSFSRWSRQGEDAVYNPMKIAAQIAVPFIKTPTAIALWTVDNFPGVAQTKWALSALGRGKTARLLKEKQDALKGAQDIIDNATNPDFVKDAKGTIGEMHEEIDEISTMLALEKAEIAASGIASTVMITGMATLVMNSNMTGTGAFLNDDQRRRMIDAGYKFNHIKIGDKQWDYSRLEPFAVLLSMTADLIHYIGLRMVSGGDLLDDEVSLIQALHTSFATNLSNKYFVRGLHEILRVVVDPKANIEDVGAGYIATLSPTIIRDLAQINEPYQRMASDMESRLKERMLGMHPGQYRRNLLGEKVERVWSADGAWGIISPIAMSDLPDDEVLKKIAAVRGTLGQARIYRRQGIDSRKYRADDNTTLYDAWMEEMSTIRIKRRTVRQELEVLFRSRKYNNADSVVFDDAESQKDMIASVLSKYRKEAWEKLVDKRPNDFYNKDGLSWTEQRKEENIKAEDIGTIFDVIGF